MSKLQKKPKPGYVQIQDAGSELRPADSASNVSSRASSKPGFLSRLKGNKGTLEPINEGQSQLSQKKGLTWNGGSKLSKNGKPTGSSNVGRPAESQMQVVPFTGPRHGSQLSASALQRHNNGNGSTLSTRHQQAIMRPEQAHDLGAIRPDGSRKLSSGTINWEHHRTPQGKRVIVAHGTRMDVIDSDSD